MRAFEATVVIDASPEQVWAVLTDVASWPQWDSGVTRVDGSARLGERLTIAVAANPGRAFPVKVVTVEPPAQLVFRGGMPLGLFAGVRTYTLAAEGATTRFSMKEAYSGPLASLITRSIPDLGPSFRQFAEGLKRRTEAGGQEAAPA
jgi:uncharacterized protein YndB with AHSA1/START domain